jgi:hypothetical protein
MLNCEMKSLLGLNLAVGLFHTLDVDDVIAEKDRRQSSRMFSRTPNTPKSGDTERARRRLKGGGGGV